MSMGFPMMSIFPIPDGTYTVSTSINNEWWSDAPPLNFEEQDRQFLKDCGIAAWELSE